MSLQKVYKYQKNITFYQIFNQEEDSDSKDNINIINNYENILDINIFTKLLKVI